ncbi:PepSY domain-containing protein [Priestia megaterium]|uniref:PepSY domain-containing protein n=1 Tax=Priestia megaterium TaxID=1404 RepID=UPI002E1D823F|nr:PepSY domain-containing protein [Priestia megaterium]
MIGKVLAGKAVVAKAVGGATIGTAIALGSMTSAFASDGQHITSTKASAHTEAATYTQAQAKAIALKNCGGMVKSVGFNDGVYTFLIHGKDSRNHHVKVNAQSGKVIQIQSAAFTKAQVQSIALKNCSGTIQSSSYANDVYTFLIHGKDNKDHHVKVNAETGKVMKVEAVKFTQEQAKQAALQQHKGTVQSVSFSEQAYTFVIKGTDNIKHTVKISPQTGKVC